MELRKIGINKLMILSFLKIEIKIGILIGQSIFLQFNVKCVISPSKNMKIETVQ